MDLTESDLGESYVDGTRWQMLAGVPELNIAAPTATGACVTPVLYKFTPPSCLKRVNVKITTDDSMNDYAFGITDDEDISQSRCIGRQTWIQCVE